MTETYRNGTIILQSTKNFLRTDAGKPVPWLLATEEMGQKETHCDPSTLTPAKQNLY